MKKTILVILIFTCSVNILGQIDDPENKRNKTDMLKTWSMSDTKSIQKHYQNIFSLKSKEKEDQLLPSFDIDKEKLLEKLREAIPLQGPVDPDNYVVGPGDIFDINIWGSIPASFTTIVTPEGSLVIPTIGIVDVRNKTLTETKEAVKIIGEENYKNAEITATLFSPRVFSVSVGGVVNNPGSYYASSVQRVDEVIYLANLQTSFAISGFDEDKSKKEQLIKDPGAIQYFRNDQLREQERNMSLRNIKVVRSNGDTLLVDLVRYYATGDVMYNPYLRDGDRIYIPNLDLHGNSISISGEVRLEGEYEYTLFDSLSSIFSIAQGPTNQADLQNVQLYRTDLKTGEFEELLINLEAVLNGSAEDIKLQPGDRIVIRKKYPRETPLNVTIKGEVKYPGLYPIKKNTTTLKEIIAKAGGFTEDASLAESKIVRFADPIDKALTNPDYVRLNDMRLSELNNRQREYFNYEYSIKRDFVAADFKKLFDENQENQNVILQNGDIIIVPQKQNTIYVYGQVPKDGYYTFEENKSWEYYIQLAGGYAEMADDGQVKIIKAGTKNWLEPDDAVLEPGDAIWVPREKDFEDKSFAYYFSWFSDIVAVLAGIATVIIVVQK